MNDIVRYTPNHIIKGFRTEGTGMCEFENAVYIRYLDHVLIRNSSPCQYNPVEREALGWLAKKDEKAIWIIADRAVRPILDHDSGLILLRSDVLELKRLNEPDVKYSLTDSDCCRVRASKKGSEKLDPHKQRRKQQ